MSNEQNREHAVEVISTLVNGYKQLNPSHIKESSSYALNIVAIAESVGKVKIGNQVRFICEDLAVLSDTLDKAKTSFYHFEAAYMLFTHHYEMNIPCPPMLHNFVCKVFNGDIKKPRKPESRNKDFIDSFIVSLFNAGKEHVSVIAPDEYEPEKSVAGIINEVIPELGAPKTIYNRYVAATKKNKSG